MHVRGFTQHPSSGVPEARRGTYAGVIDKILPARPGRYRRGTPAGVPVRQPRCARRQAQLLGIPAGLLLRAASGLQLATRRPQALDEFRDMVKALHRAGIEVILDVVFNHTTEGGHTGRRSATAASNEFYYTLSRTSRCMPTSAAAATP